MKNTIYILLGLLVLSAGVYFFFFMNEKNPEVTQNTQTQNDVSVATTTATSTEEASKKEEKKEVLAESYVWSSSVTGEDASGAPISEVSLRGDGLISVVGTAQGDCSSGLDLLNNQVSSYLCYWAGFGTEYGLFKEGDKLVIKKGVVEEGSGESEGFRGDFEVIKTL